MKDTHLGGRFLCLALLMILSACGPLDQLLGRNVLPPATYFSTTPELWCYRTVGAVECYGKPIPDGLERLVNVDPPSLYPASREEYVKRVAQSQ